MLKGRYVNAGKKGIGSQKKQVINKTEQFPDFFKIYNERFVILARYMLKIKKYDEKYQALEMRLVNGYAVRISTLKLVHIIFHSVGEWEMIFVGQNVENNVLDQLFPGRCS